MPFEHKAQILADRARVAPLNFGYVSWLHCVNQTRRRLRTVTPTIGGTSTLLVGTIFLVAAYVHWSFCTKHPATLPVRRQPARFTFARPGQPQRPCYLA